MSESAEEINTLEQDVDLAVHLKRVAYHAGMMLGIDATKDEQAYHRRRVNRLNYWIQGYGTLLGMVVTVSPESSSESDPILTRLIVSPGVGIDALGREVLINEDYCIDLGEWLRAQSETDLREGYDEVENRLWLKVVVRYQDCDVAKQPIVGRKLNLSTDAVQSSRKADSVFLTIVPEIPPENETRYKPWSSHDPIDDETPDGLNLTEENYLTAVEGANEEAFRLLQLHSRMLFALQNNAVNPPIQIDQIADSGFILLARFAIEISDLNIILDAQEGEAVVNPNDIYVNNLVRPFITTSSQLDYLSRTSGE
ncbi:hypothetical protein FLL45_20355 [Aliikangiella marina]|uniref:Uncharacterized protein n=1 Tax=Aliikangiella marina TaxID=1712262 RepID=A0A545T2R8_9GAMM|nr:hypothetical protein [Aliikangiella marina]TQV71506.1 hypothetical protein FLL45_20355 [Aliikangiella marina]